MKESYHRLENTNNGSNKFWEVRHIPDNGQYQIAYGKIGTKGQTKTMATHRCKSGCSDCSADSVEEFQATIKKKLKEGYVKVSTKTVKPPKPDKNALPEGVTLEPNGLYKKMDADDECTYWYKDVKCKILHRLDGPAVEYDNGDYAYYVDGKLHRVDGPARYVAEDKEETWFFEGKEHRDGGPAYSSQYLKKWMQHGKNHRLDGPAVIDQDYGDTDYYVNGKQLTASKFFKKHGTIITTTSAESLLDLTIQLENSDYSFYELKFVDHQGKLAVLDTKPDASKNPELVYLMGHQMVTEDGLKLGLCPILERFQGKRTVKVADIQDVSMDTPKQEAEPAKEVPARKVTMGTVAAEVLAKQFENLAQKRMGGSGKIGAQFTSLILGHALPKVHPGADQVGKRLRTGALASLGTDAMDSFMASAKAEFSESSKVRLDVPEKIEEKVELTIPAIAEKG